MPRIPDNQFAPHPTKKIWYPHDECWVKIDTKIVPLMQAIWNAGLRSTSSCQENDMGKVWVEFPGQVPLCCFLTIVGKPERGVDALYNRMFAHGDD